VKPAAGVLSDICAIGIAIAQRNAHLLQPPQRNIW
jgi:hypothetical protein